MNILFIGNYQNGPGGEAADEAHLAREMERAGHTVYRVPRDEWREYVLEGFPIGKYKVPEDIKVDIAIIAKWHHFFDGQFIDAIKVQYNCPVFYWVWDYMEGNSVEDWHMSMAKEADLYLSGEIGLAHYYHSNGIRFYYFQFDSTDGEFSYEVVRKKDIDVVFTGSCSNQNGKLDILKAINAEIPLTVFGYDHEEWTKQGFNAFPAVYGQDFNNIIAKSKIVLGTSAGPDCFGYWSNRVGKVLYARGFLLQQFTPGMETLIGDAADYFSNAEEAIYKIHYYLENPDKILQFKQNSYAMNPGIWTSAYKVKQLTILMERYLKSNGGKTWLLP
jgi:hypothetical protein